MFCPECGGEYREGFFDCADCHRPLVPQLPEGFTPKPRAGLPGMAPDADAAPVEIAGRSLVCGHCEHDHFTVRSAQLHSALMTFLNLEWAGKSASLYVCARCGHIHWFLPSG